MRRWKTRVAGPLLMVAVLAGMGVLALAGAAPAAFPGANGKIAFPRDGQIWVMNADGSGQVSLTTTTPPAGDVDPAWSADGTKIVFTRCDGVQCDIAVMNADGSGQTLVTSTAASEGRPGWSPDGTKIVFERICGMRCIDIWTMNADGTDPTNVTNDTAPDFPYYANPVWSPDGAKLAFQASLSDTNVEIYVSSPDGSGLDPITSNGVNSRAPDWSPDGAKIVFDRGPAGSAEIYVMNQDGSDPTNVTNAGGISVDGSWSPDGTKIVFIRQVPGSAQIYSMNADGTSQTALTAPSAAIGVPDWQPAGEPADTTAPTITITTPPEGAVYTVGQVVKGDYACADEAGGSGLASCIGNVADGAALATTGVGSRTFTVTATDKAGNTAQATHTYSVVYDFFGFFWPVSNPPALNTVKAGWPVLVVFGLHGYQGRDVFAAGYPKSEQIACGSTPETAGAESTSPAGARGLAYEPFTRRYVYLWVTKSSWRSSCRQLVVQLADGSSHRANFRFK